MKSAAIKPIILSMVTMMVSVSPALAQQDVRGVKLRGEEIKVVEEKCLSCHNEQRIDKAVKERRDMDEILKKMGKKGVVLTDRERQVMGHFWGQKMYKEK